MGIDHAPQQHRLRLVPQVGQGDEAQAGTHALHTRALVVRGDGPRGHRGNVWVRLLDKGQQAVQVLHLIPRRILVHQPLFCRLPGDGAAVQRQVHALSIGGHQLVAHRLVHVAVQVVVGRLGWQQVGQRHNLVAVLLAQDHVVAGILAATH